LQEGLVIFIDNLDKQASVGLEESGLTKVHSEGIPIVPEIQNISVTIDAPTEDFGAEQIMDLAERFALRSEKLRNRWERSQDLKESRAPQPASTVPDTEEIPVYSGREQRALR